MNLKNQGTNIYANFLENYRLKKVFLFLYEIFLFLYVFDDFYMFLCRNR